MRRRAVGELVLLGTCLLLVAGLGVAIGALITGPLAGSVSRHLDLPARSFALAHPSAFWDGVLGPVEKLATASSAAALAVVIGCAFALATRSPKPLVQCVIAFAGAALITLTVREVVTRPAEYGPVKGFPSGHVLLAVAVWGSAGVL